MPTLSILLVTPQRWRKLTDGRLWVAVAAGRTTAPDEWPFEHQGGNRHQLRYTLHLMSTVTDTKIWTRLRDTVALLTVMTNCMNPLNQSGHCAHALTSIFQVTCKPLYPCESTHYLYHLLIKFTCEKGSLIISCCIWWPHGFCATTNIVLIVLVDVHSSMDIMLS